MFKIKETMLPYVDSNGFVQDRPQGEKGWYSGNGPVRTAEACVVLEEFGELTSDLKEQFLAASRRTWEPAVGFAKEPTHWRDSQDSVDNLVGHIVIATFCGDNLAIRAWIARGNAGFKLPKWPFKIRYYFPNEPQYRLKAGWRAYFGKFLAARAAAHWTVGESAGWFLNLGWVFTIATTGLWSKITRGEGGQDAYILSDLLIAHARKLGRIGGLYKWAIQKAEKRRESKYPGGKAEISEKYFKQGPDQWLVKAYEELYVPR